MISFKTFLVRNKPMLSFWRRCNHIATAANKRFYSTATHVEVRDEAKSVESMTDEEKLIARCHKFGADLAFNNKKHAYVLSFPWNFEGVINDFEKDFKPLDANNFWHKWVFNRECDRDFNELFRVFHQSWAIPEDQGIERVCEPKLANYIKKSVKSIHFHGMDIEMANLRVHQPKIDILHVEVHNGLSVTRSHNKSREDYDIAESTLMGAPLKIYTNKSGDSRSVFDHLNSDYKPYLVSVTTLIHSPMKLFVYNQNRTKILFGSNDEEIVKNVVKFEINVRWLEFFKILPVPMKPLLSRQWKITDYNNVLNENPYFEEK